MNIQSIQAQNTSANAHVKKKPQRPIKILSRVLIHFVLMSHEISADFKVRIISLLGQ